jgi:hypothetical protein
MRGAIIRAALFGAYCLVILATIAAGIAGYNYGAFVLILFKLPVTETYVLAARAGGAVVGAIVGFIASSFASAVIFLLRDIARRTTEAVEFAELAAAPPSSRRPAESRDPRPPRWS